MDDWEKRVQEFREAGAAVIAPNDLPIKCIRHDGTLMEHEHADMPTYICPVRVHYTGDKADVTEDLGDGLVVVEDSETHALLWSDGGAALTMYECSYYLWNVNTGAQIQAPTGSSRAGSWRKAASGRSAAGAWWPCQYRRATCV